MAFLKAFGYVQVNGKSQVEIDGLKRQERIIRDYAAGNGIILEQIYSEKCSADNLDNRLAFAKMLISLDLNEQEIKTVVVECLDRLSCEFILQEIIIQYLQSRGYDLVSVRECKDHCYEEPSRKLVHDTVGIVTAYHKQIYELKMRAWREFIQQVERSRIGDSGSARGAPKKRPSSVPLDVAKEIKKLRCKLPGHKQMTCQEIADVLNNLGYTASNGRPFDSHLVRTVLKRPQKA